MMDLRRYLCVLGVCATIVALTGTGGCGANKGSGFDGTGGSSSASASGSSGGGGSSGDTTGGSSGDIISNGGGGCLTCGGAPAKPCTTGGLDCYVKQGCSTTLSGTVYDPAGRNPLYNVVVFVPNDPMGKLPAITPGTHSCNTCDVSIGNYVAATTSDVYGHFTLSGVPATTHVPLVVQTGKWRREVFLNSVTACQDNQVAATNSRLPRNHMEGDMPQMALLTGGCDDLGCFMRSIGVDASEFTAPHGGGRLDIYQGGALLGNGANLANGNAGNCTGTACPLWASKQSFEYYDISIFSCECSENNNTKPAAGMQALHDWLAEGGKVFASHFHYTWFKNNPQMDYQMVANWLGTSIASGMGNYDLDTSFPKGMILQQWLARVGAISGSAKAIALNNVATSAGTVNMTKPYDTVRWIYDGPSNKNTNDTKYLSFLTPIGGVPGSTGGENGGPNYCGKAVFTDLHTSASLMAQAMTIPDQCSGAKLSPQQAALEFLFFDLSACVAPDNKPPPPPPPSVQ